MQSWIFRFVSILGERYTHGHVFDFYKQLLEHPTYLNVLGNGEQRKSYLYVQDCISGIFHALNTSNDYVNIFNLGNFNYCKVNDSIKWMCDYLYLDPELRYTGEDRGWIGDNPCIHLDISKMTKLGWEPTVTIKEGVIKTVRYLENNPSILERK